MKKKLIGFTLIELLAVIVIIAVLAVIAVPIVGGIIDRVKREAFKDSAYSYIKVIEYYIASSNNDDLMSNNQPTDGLFTNAKLDIKGTSPTEVELNLVDGKVVSGYLSYDGYSVVIDNTEIKDVIDDNLMLSILGDSPITHEAKTAYTDLGAVAYDVVDGSLTESIVVENNVDPNKIGEYTVIYRVTNSAGLTKTRTRVVNVVDTTSPLIELLGDNPYVHNAGETYSELGYIVIDSYDGDISNLVEKISNITPGILGTYKIIYSVTDSSGNKASVERRVDIIDESGPAVTFSNNGTLKYEKSASTKVGVNDVTGIKADTLKYIWTNSTDRPDAKDITTPFTSGDELKTPADANGIYYLWVSAVDKLDNVTITSSNAFKLDSIAPSLTMLGDTPLYFEAEDTYKDPGATANDNILGNMTDKIVVTMNVASGIKGTYEVKYEVTDEAGNTSSATRVVQIIDSNGPVIKLIGANPLTIEVGSIFDDPGATSKDGVDGDLTSSIQKTHNVTPRIIGTYKVTYTSTDASGNTNTMERTVIVDDTTPPTVAFVTNGSLVYSKLKSTIVNVTDFTTLTTLKFKWTNSTIAPSEDSFTSSFTTGSNLQTPNGLSGEYYLWILAKDYRNNKTIIRSNKFLLDNTAPTITILGANPAAHPKNEAYVDAGVSVNDNEDGSITKGISVISNVTAGILGTYEVKYTVSDSSGNTATATRVVNVIDVTPPVITFSLNGSSTYAKSRTTLVNATDDSAITTLKYLWKNNTTEPSIADFNYSLSSGSSITTPPGVDGDYYLWIYAKDSKDNYVITRSNAFKMDNIAPTITIVGNTTINHEVKTTYSDLGATASDNIDGNITNNISADMQVAAGMVGTYTVTYTVSDSSGNSVSVSRIINVIDTTAPIITLLGDNPYRLVAGTTWSDPGATASDTNDGNLTSSISKESKLAPLIPGVYEITYSVKDSANNTSSIKRIVNVVDESDPVITFGTLTSTTYTKISSTSVSVTDTYSGVDTTSLRYLWTTSTTAPTDWTNSFTNNSSLSTTSGLNGTYYLWVYAKDLSGNETITRTDSFYIDNTAPTISLSDYGPYEITVGDTYVDPTITKSDNSGKTPTITRSTIPSTSGTYTITYTATDEAGNTASATRTLYLWSTWSNWSTTSQVASDTKQVQESTQYRYRTGSWGAYGSYVTTRETTNAYYQEEIGRIYKSRDWVVVSENYNSCADAACGIASTVYKTCVTPGCGVYQYNSCATADCGVSQYNLCQSADCGQTCTNKTCTSSACCGSTCTTNTCRTAACGCELWCNPEEGACSGGKTDYFYSCGRYKTCTHIDCGQTCTAKTCTSSCCGQTCTNNTCRTAACGVASYLTCRDDACGVESYNSCSNAECGVSYYNYNTCQTQACGVASYNYGWSAWSGYQYISGTSCPTDVPNSKDYDYCQAAYKYRSWIWGSWSNWQDSPVTPETYKQVETQRVYSYRTR